MSEETPELNPPMSTDEEAFVAKLTDEDLKIIGSAILANASNRWSKVARVVISTVNMLSDRYPGLSYVFYAQYLSRLADDGQLESRGNLAYMRFSEVRIPAQPEVVPLA